jgi:hypothetical protein
MLQVEILSSSLGKHDYSSKKFWLQAAAAALLCGDRYTGCHRLLVLDAQTLRACGSAADPDYFPDQWILNQPQHGLFLGYHRQPHLQSPHPLSCMVSCLIQLPISTGIAPFRQSRLFASEVGPSSSGGIPICHRQALRNWTTAWTATGKLARMASSCNSLIRPTSWDGDGLQDVWSTCMAVEKRVPSFV